jgi:competence protein ComEA
MIYLAWNISIAPASPSSIPGVTQQNFGNGATSTTTKNSSGNVSTGSGDIQAYIVGAVKNPGVYTLPAGARVYALLQAAGGPLPKANLVALNLAATLTDGEEVYVTLIGEIVPKNRAFY